MWGTRGAIPAGAALLHSASQADCDVEAAGGSVGVRACARSRFPEAAECLVSARAMLRLAARVEGGLATVWVAVWFPALTTALANDAGTWTCHGSAYETRVRSAKRIRPAARSFKGNPLCRAIVRAAI